MPNVNFENLPDSAQVWVYGADADLSPEAEKKMLGAVDDFLGGWAAHGVPLHTARKWGDGRFLTIAVDREREGASGCSIDVLYRTLKSLEPSLGAHIVTSGLIYFRDRAGKIRAVTREEFTELSAKGEIDGATEVFDLTVTTLGEWRARFRSRAEDSWHASLMSAGV
jgi:hypothetical protein